MKLFSLLFFAAISGTLITGCKKGAAGDGAPDLADSTRPGSSRSINVDITYASGLIENTSSWATWPVAIFSADAKAISYKVRLYGFSGTFSSPPEGQTTTWKAGELPPTDYNIYQSTNGIKDGKYYFTIGRTWCSGCHEPNPVWLTNYKNGWGTPKAEVTYQY